MIALLTIAVVLGGGFILGMLGLMLYTLLMAGPERFKKNWERE